MKKIKYLILFTCIVSGAGLYAQPDTARSKVGTYFFDGNDVVFQFDKRDYEKALRSSDSLSVDFADLRIKKVAVSGDFNNQSTEGWRMKRMDENRYQLRKPLRLFTDAPNWQFKFVINGNYWTGPDSVLITQGLLGWYDIQNPEMNGPEPNDTGNVLFKLPGFTNKKRVILTGSFNNWNEEHLEMKKTATGWELRLYLPPGIYEYKFIADGEWMHDHQNPETRRNQYNTLNSVLLVNTPVVFRLKGYDNATQVILTGTFNNWDTDALSMHKSADGWYINLPLISGKHLYKFIVDGQWITDPDNRRTEMDTDGNLNSVRLIH